MELLRLIASLNPDGGGPIESLMQSSVCQVELGAKTTVVVCDSPNADRLPDARLAHLKIVALGEGRYGWGYHSELIPWLREHIERFDTVLVHGLWLYHSYATKKVVNQLRLTGREIQFSILPHGMFDSWFQSWGRRSVKTLRNVLYRHLIEKHVMGRAFKHRPTRKEQRKPR